MSDFEAPPDRDDAQGQGGDELLRRLRGLREGWREDLGPLITALSAGTEPEGTATPELHALNAEFTLDLPVTRADVVAEAIAALDRRWQLVLALVEEQGEPAGDDPLQFDLGAGLHIVDARIASLHLTLRPSRRGLVKLAGFGSAALAVAAGIAQVSGFDLRDVGRGFTPQGDRCEPVGRPPLEPGDLQQLGQRLGRLPTGAAVRIEIELDNGAHYVVVMPPFAPGDLPRLRGSAT